MKQNIQPADNLWHNCNCETVDYKKDDVRYERSGFPLINILDGFTRPYLWKQGSFPVICGGVSIFCGKFRSGNNKNHIYVGKYEGQKQYLVNIKKKVALIAKYLEQLNFDQYRDKNEKFMTTRKHMKVLLELIEHLWPIKCISDFFYFPLGNRKRANSTDTLIPCKLCHISDEVPANILPNFTKLIILIGISCQNSLTWCTFLPAKKA